MSKKSCELCCNQATMFCESDQASLCWDCDAKVHAANFLVAKHTRTLLCHLCTSPTPWKAAGSILGATVSVCHACAQHGEYRTSILNRREEDCDSQESECDDDYSDSEEEEGENQVVPLSASSSGSSTEEDSSVSSLKRMRGDDRSVESEDEDGYYSSPDLELEGNYGSSSMNLFRPLKMPRICGGDGVSPVAGGNSTPEASSSFGRAPIIDKLTSCDLILKL